MRALTLSYLMLISLVILCNNEALAREGIDTCKVYTFIVAFFGNNEALAREGIDTFAFPSIAKHVKG